MVSLLCSLNSCWGEGGTVIKTLSCSDMFVSPSSLWIGTLGTWTSVTPPFFGHTHSIRKFPSQGWNPATAATDL